MTEVESQVLEKYKDTLAQQEGVTPELVEALTAELSKETPNAERIADILRLKKVNADD